jgi:RNA polymerase sigma-70 factor (ECF subfamily)
MAITMEPTAGIGASSQHHERESSNQVADHAMDRYARGDEAAFAALYDALAPKLYAFVLRKVHDSARAEDLVQATLVRIIAARGRFVAGSHVTPWAFAILHRLFLDQVKRKKIEIPSDGRVSDDPPSEQPGPEECADFRERDQLLRRALDSLSAPQRLTYELIIFEQLTHAEAAEVLGVTVAAIKLRLQRAKHAITEALHAPHGEGAEL